MKNRNTIYLRQHMMYIIFLEVSREIIRILDKTV